MARWNSLAEMATELGLIAEPSDRQSLAGEIRRLMGEAHPDRSGGEFATPVSEARYKILSEALDYIGRESSTALVPIHEFTAMVAAIKQAIEPRPQEQTAAQVRAEFRGLAREELHHRMLLPRIGSGTFAAICAFLLTISETLKDDPILGQSLNSPTGRLCIAMALMYSAMFFAWTWWSEQRAAAAIEWLATEAGRGFILSRVLEETYSLGKQHPSDPASHRFTFLDVVSAIRRDSNRGLKLPMLPRGMSHAAAEKLAKAHMDELEERGIVKKVASKRIDTVYEMDQEAFLELRERRMSHLTLR